MGGGAEPKSRPSRLAFHHRQCPHETETFVSKDSCLTEYYFQRIFEKFGQVHGRKVRGTGLGLTFCRLAVEAHGGRIWVESEEGAGSVFAFALPVNR